MKLGTEVQGRSYDMMISHTTIVYSRYIILEWLRRNEKDQKTFDELFFMFWEDIQNMELITALQSLMGLFTEQINTVGSKKASTIKTQLQYWIDSQALFIRALFADLI